MVEIPTPSTATPAAVAPPTMSTPVPSADLSGLTTPATQPSLQGTQEFQSAVTGENAALQRVQQLSKPEAPAAPVPHARLLAMVSGLATGLSAFGTAIATGGKEGGAKEVAQIQGEQQQQKIQAQQATAAQKNTQIQQQLMVADTNHKLGQNILLMSALPDEIAQRHLAVSGEQLRQKGEQQTQSIQGSEYALAHGGMSPDEVQAAVHSDAPVGSLTGKSTFFSTNAQQTLAAAKTAGLPDTDPFVHNLQKKLNDPNTKAGDLMLATGQLAKQQQMQSVSTDEKIKRDAAEAAARPKDLNDATGRLTQAAQAYKDNPTPETSKARDAAQSAVSIFEQEDRKKKQMEQDVQSGDPEVLGHALFAGTYAPSQLLSARSMSKPVYAKVIATADADAKAAGMPEIIGPNGVHTGSYFNAAKAEAQYEYSKNPQTQNVMNKIRTLNEKGGDFDILKDAAVALPKYNEQTINKIFNVTGKEFGSSTVSNYHMALYNLASLLANVQTGGIPTEGEIQTQLDLMKDSFSKGQLDGTIQIAHKDIAARGAGMIGDNPYLSAAYPDLAKTSQQETPSSGKGVSLADARALPANKGKSDAEITADIQKHGHQVIQ